MTDLLARADAHMQRFPHHDLVAKLAARVREVEGLLAEYVSHSAAGAVEHADHCDLADRAREALRAEAEEH